MGFSESVKQGEWTNDLLSLLLTDPSSNRYLKDALGLLQDWTGCRCAGIRILQAGGAVPYEVWSGFSEDFWREENMLSINCDECACIRVIRRAPEPQDIPCMTRVGSFYSGRVQDFARNLTAQELSRFRGRCVLEGFETVAVIPVVHERQMVGAIHLADERPGLLSEEMLRFLESVAPIIGEAYDRPLSLSQRGIQDERLARGLGQEPSLDLVHRPIYTASFTRRIQAHPEARGAPRI